MTQPEIGEDAAPRTEAPMRFYDPGNYDGPSYNAGFEDGKLHAEAAQGAAAPPDLDVERLERFYHDTRTELDCYHPGGDTIPECVAFAAAFAYPDRARLSGAPTDSTEEPAPHSHGTGNASMDLAFPSDGTCPICGRDSTEER